MGLVEKQKGMKYFMSNAWITIDSHLPWNIVETNSTMGLRNFSGTTERKGKFDFLHTFHDVGHTLAY